MSDAHSPHGLQVPPFFVEVDLLAVVRAPLQVPTLGPPEAYLRQRIARSAQRLAEARYAVEIVVCSRSALSVVLGVACGQSPRRTLEERG